MAATFPEHDPKYRVIKSPDPTNKGCWPKAPSKYVFIFEAINLVGLALFKDDWTGKELTAVHWAQSPRADRKEARFSPARGGGARGSGSFGSIPLPRKERHDFHVEDWRAELRQPRWEENGRAMERLEQAVEWLAQRCRDAELTSYARFRDVGGNLWPMWSVEWNVESALFHFVIHGGKKRHFPQLKQTGPFESFVFFEKAELLAALKREPASPLLVGEADLSRLSPYLQSAVRLALKKGYTSRETCDTNPVREAEIRAAWPDLLPEVTISKNAVEAIARVIGFPDNNAIGTGLRAKADKKGGRLKA